jgi:hypothetical protein
MIEGKAKRRSERTSRALWDLKAKLPARDTEWR